MALQVRKLEIVGANCHGLRTGGNPSGQTIAWLKGRGVKAVARVVRDGVKGVIPLRLDDIPEGMLGHTLIPGHDLQGFVQPRDMRVVGGVLEGIAQAAARFETVQEAAIDWATLPFDLNFPERTSMFLARVRHTLDDKKHTVRGGWEAQVTDFEAHLFPFGDVLESPAAQVKHYGQAVFEGMKAFRIPDGRIVGFRWKDNARRLARSARRLALTPAPTKFYLDAIGAAVLANQDLVPPPGLRAAMYVRPVQYGSGPRLGVKEAGEETLIVFVSPVGPYYQLGFKPIHIMTPSSSIRRSGEGLTGGVKGAGNYVMGLIEAILAKEEGFSEVLWVRTKTEKGGRAVYYPEEIGSSNLFYVIDGEIYTPELTDTILPGITRDSIIKLARALGMKAHEVELPLERVLRDSSEVFCTGTAAVITPVGSITHRGERTLFNDGEAGLLTQRLYDALVAVQEGRFNDPSLEGIRPDLFEEFKETWIYYLEG